MTHHRSNGTYAYSLVEFDHAAGGKKIFKVNEEGKASALNESLHQTLQHLYNGDPEDYFQALRASPLHDLQPSPRRSFAAVKRGAICAALGGAVMWFTYTLVFPGLNETTPRLQGAPRRGEQTQMVPMSPALVPAKPSAFRAASSTAAKTTPLPQPGPLPRTGWYQKPKGAALVAPLSITTPSGNGYYMKLMTPTGSNVGSLFVRGGETAKVEVPLGHYRIRYAYGPTWYSTQLLFGDTTRYAELDTDLNFTISESQTSGYEITLIKQRNGNLPEHAVSADTF